MYVIFLLGCGSLLGGEVKSTPKKNTDTASEAEKLKNIKRYYPEEYQNYYRGIHTLSHPHPLMTGVILSFIPSKLLRDDCIPFGYMHNKASYGDMEPCGTPRVEYPVDIAIFSDRALKKKIGVIHFGFDEKAKEIKKEKPSALIRNGSLKTTSGMSFTPYRDLVTGHVKINGKKSCKYTPKGKHIYNVNLGEDCDVVNYFSPWFEVNSVHKDSYEIKQKDGSSIFLSKKEMKPYVYKEVESNQVELRKYLKEAQIKKMYALAQEINRDLKNISEQLFLDKYLVGVKRDSEQERHKEYQKFKLGMSNLMVLRDFRYSKTHSKNDSPILEYTNSDLNQTLLFVYSNNKGAISLTRLRAW